MEAKQSAIQSILNSPQAAELLKNRQAAEDLLRSGEARQLLEQLNRGSGDALKKAAQSAMQGDAAQLMGLVEGLMKNPENAKLAEQLNSRFQ